MIGEIQVARFSDFIGPPYLHLDFPRGTEAGYFRPTYNYAGLKKVSITETKLFRFVLTYIPIASSSSGIHYQAKEDRINFSISGTTSWWDASGEEVFVGPYDAFFNRDHPYCYRNAGSSAVWQLMVRAPEDGASPTVYYDKAPAIEEMKTKGMTNYYKLIQFQSLHPTLAGQKISDRPWFRPTYNYVGSDENAAVKSKMFSFGLLHLPISSSFPTFLAKVGADEFFFVIDGDVLVLDQNGNRTQLHTFDGVLLREHPIKMHNVGRQDAWLAFAYAPPNITDTIYE